MSHERLSHYELLERLGAGGMGVVYKARDTKLERLVAIKLLKPEAVADPDRVLRFLQEAKTTSGLNHPSIATIHQLGEAAGRHFITMEFVDGENLRERLRRGPFELRPLLDIGVQVAEGLATAHAAGVVHRDLKPENVMVRPDGFVKLLDFGLAKLVEVQQRDAARLAAAAAGDETLVQPAVGSPGRAISDSAPTVPGLVLGTVGYMSPEQVRGERVDSRCDIFALGSVLYELATGVRPFGAGSPIEVMHAILKEQPKPIHERRPDLPVELERILRKSMAKDPEERYQTAKDLAIDLRALRREVDSGTLTATYAAISGASRAVSPARRTRIGVAAGALVLLAAVAATFAWRHRTPAPAPRQMEITRVTSTGVAAAPAITPDGKYVAYVSTEGGRSSIWLRQLATPSAVQLVPPVDAILGALAFAPDGDWLYYLSLPPGTAYRTLWQIPTLGGTPRKVLDDVDTPVSFSPDGQQFVFQRNILPSRSEIYVGDAAGARPPRLLAGQVKEYLDLPQWSPDGKSIATVMRDPERPLSARIGLLPAAGGTPSVLENGSWAEIVGLCWASDGSALYVSAHGQERERGLQLFLVSARDGTARQLTSDLSSYANIGVSADGRTLVSTRSLTSTTLWRISVSGSAADNAARAVKISSGTAQHQWPDVSPDGRSIVYVSDASGSIDLWRMDVDGGNAHQITSGPARDVQPEWSPDGRWIAFASLRDDSLNVWVMDSSGDNRRQLTHDSWSGVPSWSPDGRWITYQRRDAMKWSIWRVPADGGPSAQVLADWSVLPHWSPDGSSILCWVRIPGDPNDLPQPTLISPEGRVLRRLEIPFDFKNSFYCWTPDGKSITRSISEAGASNLVDYPIDGGAPRPITAFAPGMQTLNWTWVHDGSAIVCERGDVSQDVVLLRGFR